MIYYANFNANNGTSFRTPIDGTNKNDLIKRIRVSQKVRDLPKTNVLGVFGIKKKTAFGWCL